mgnify:CR=1 FL=1
MPIQCVDEKDARDSVLSTLSRLKGQSLRNLLSNYGEVRFVEVTDKELSELQSAQKRIKLLESLLDIEQQQVEDVLNHRRGRIADSGKAGG